METLDTEQMVNRFHERAEGVRNRNFPPIAGAERKAFIQQAELDYQDFAIIADAKISLDGGILTIDLRPAICDATIRNSPSGITDKTAERETQVAMENIAGALPTDGDKIKTSQLDAGADLQALVEDSSRFLTVIEKVEPIVDGERTYSTAFGPVTVQEPSGFSLTHGYLA